MEEITENLNNGQSLSLNTDPKKRSKAWIFIVVAVIIVVGILAYIFFFRGMNEANNSGTSQSGAVTYAVAGKLADGFPSELIPSFLNAGTPEISYGITYAGSAQKTGSATASQPSNQQASNNAPQSGTGNVQSSSVATAGNAQSSSSGQGTTAANGNTNSNTAQQTTASMVSNQPILFDAITYENWFRSNGWTITNPPVPSLNEQGMTAQKGSDSASVTFISINSTSTRVIISYLSQ